MSDSLCATQNTFQTKAFKLGDLVERILESRVDRLGLRQGSSLGHSAAGLNVSLLVLTVLMDYESCVYNGEPGSPPVRD